jgi:hypothetical protein
MRTWFTILVLAAADAAPGQNPAIGEASAGRIAWSNELPNAIQSVEWSAAPDGWTSGWSGQQDLPPVAGRRTVDVPAAYRIVSRLVATGLPDGARAWRVAPDGAAAGFASVALAGADAQPGDLLLLAPGVHALPSFTVGVSNLTFAGLAPPDYDPATRSFRSGAVWDGGLTLGAVPGLTFFNLGFMNSSGGDVFMMGLTATNVLDAHLAGCVFAGSGTNAHNLEVRGRYVRIERCRSYYGQHNAALKCQDFTVSGLFSYQPSINGLIVKASAAWGDVARGAVDDVTIEGAPGGIGTIGVHVEAYDPGSSASALRFSRLHIRNAGLSVYLWPHAGAAIRDVTIDDAEARGAQSGFGDYLVNAGASAVKLIDCRSYGATGVSFVNFGNPDVSLLGCTSDRAAGDRSFGAFRVRYLNASIGP